MSAVNPAAPTASQQAAVEAALVLLGRMACPRRVAGTGTPGTPAMTALLPTPSSTSPSGWRRPPTGFLIADALNNVVRELSAD